ncbi:formin-binding protein 4-like isoform X2 [Cucurbita pepo subsp. pepo]|uniref:formin-binding protein 4-like isoform X2 n=1 Tax=Cucurbita pepo subsp. pepo TaxID=3664 RepID=UPI000C9D872D|nr:formin-binding protein 4-like isoform X2 [Cucurbita pepo subsp. pepo]
MGRRRERRLAALSNAGRRVKLDLFAEPSGDLDGSDVQEEVGGDIDSRETTKLPKSASSSGHQAQNPLLLLEQYSDDEVDEDLDTNSDHDGQDALLPDRTDEVSAEGCEKMDAKVGEDLIAQKAVQEESERDSVEFSENLESRDEGKTDTNNLGYLSKETDLVQTSVPASSDVQVVGDVISGWRIVMHEESHNYYYWNVETGETSWEVPDVVLAQAQPTQSTTDIKTSPTQFPENVTVFKHESCLANGGKLDLFSAESTVCASQGSEVDQSYAAFSTCSNDVNIAKAGSEIYVDYTMTHEESKSGLDLPSHLLNWSASLLERLKSFQKSGGHEWTSEYIQETQIRLEDLKSLTPYKTSLLPFWEHSARKLKQIEDDINKEIYQTAAVSSQLDEAKATDSPNIVRANVGSEVERVACGGSASEHSHLRTVVANGENISSSNAIEHFGNTTAVIEQVSEVVIDEMASKSGVHSVEDVDMEVDMEVEDASSAGNLMVTGTSDMSVAKSFTSSEQPLLPDPQAQLNLSSGYESIVPEDSSMVPPPPDEEWIPPPPPDNEDIPPPPPDEPAEPFYPMPPSYTQLGQPPCYTEPYQVSYPDSSIKYYAHPVPEAILSANFYGHPEACNVVLAQAPFYYEAVPNSHTDSSPVVVNGVVPESYGILQDATTSLPVFSTAEPSQLHVDASSVRFEPSSSIQYRSSDIANMNTASSMDEIDKGRKETASVSFRSTSGSPTNDVLPTSKAVTDSSAVANTSTVSKVQPKAPRSKKQTVTVAPSLRSNKKVSSLLDKWKAAKEELEDEEEPENAYEILERKREREIKEWHAQQVASGDAKENSNFQPLGGDWRERVKRRRAQSSSKVTQSPAEASADGNQQPNLAEISKDLPSGWQAYWDESSKQVYYGNVKTSETSWTKPSK